MGLDSYIYLRKEEYSSEIRGNMQPYPMQIEEIITGMSKLNKHMSVKTDYLIGYWRKANAIHQWIVDNCADGVDECQEIVMPEEKIEELRTLCLQVLIDPEKGADLLPTSDGFFFGSTEYDDWYVQNIKYTAELMQRLLTFLEEYPDYDIIYKASW